MASALVQGRALAGGRAMSLVPTGSKPKAPSNGARVFMRRRDSYMVEVRRAARPRCHAWDLIDIHALS
jgi:hypothetical protein